jgi:hypothetical protein
MLNKGNNSYVPRIPSIEIAQFPRHPLRFRSRIRTGIEQRLAVIHTPTKHIGCCSVDLAPIRLGVLDPIDIYTQSLIFYKTLDTCDHLSVFKEWDRKTSKMASIEVEADFRISFSALLELAHWRRDRIRACGIVIYGIMPPISMDVLH